MKINRRASKADVPSMAMGDIAFNLLIFFVILARAEDDSHLHWQPASAVEITASGAAKVSVLIDSNNKYYINGQQVGETQIAGEVESLLSNAAAGERRVFFKVHKDAQAMYFEPAIAAISEVGGDLVHVLEQKKE
ncbi:MAG: ExbD/TolR family protein [Pirellulales bacterium]|jgi:biopolymer transport protein ExbD|tara:strand:+ start:45 stop:449 length:405 start_codon:yes stop_codon:yes gene_type:complete